MLDMLMARIRFGQYELDPETEELRREGAVVASGGKAIRLLAALLKNPGDLVTREELRRELWPEEVFVDFDGNLNAAVRRLRSLLGDAADAPTLIETLPGRGYRFIGRIKEPAAPPPGRARAGALTAVIITAALTILGAIVAFAIHRSDPPGVVIEIEGSEAGRDDTIARLLREEIGAELGLAFPSELLVVESGNGSLPDFRLRGLVHTAGDRLRVSLRLIDGRSDAQVWSDVYACSLANVYSIERKAAQELGLALGLRPREVDRAAAGSVEAGGYRLYAAGRESLRKGNLEEAARSLESALSRNPAHAPSLAGLAEVWLARSEHADASDELVREARSRALEALRIDYTLAAAHSALGWARFREGDRSGGERDLRRAVRLDPSDRVARQRLALVTGS